MAKILKMPRRIHKAAEGSTASAPAPLLEKDSADEEHAAAVAMVEKWVDLADAALANESKRKKA